VSKLVESDEVLLTFQLLGTPSNAAVQKYLNSKKVPQLFAADRRVEVHRPEEFSVDDGLQPELLRRRAHLRPVHPKRISERQDRNPLSERRLGKDYQNGIKAGLGDKAAKMIVAEASYEVSDPTIDSQILKIKDAGADLFFSATTPKQGGAGDQEDRRTCLEAGTHPRHQRHLGRCRDEAGWTRSLQGRDQRQLRQGSARSDLEGRRRHEEVFEFMAKYYPDGDKDSSSTPTATRLL